MNNTLAPKHFIFDWSGTLCDDMRSCYEASMAVFRHYKTPVIEMGEYRSQIEYPYLPFYQRYNPKMELEVIDTVFREALPSTSLPIIYKQTKPLLEYLHKLRKDMVIVTGVPQNIIESELIRLNVAQYFQEVIGSAYDKTELVLDLLNRKHWTPANVWYLGDMAHDILVGKNAKVTTVALAQGYQPRHKLEKVEPDMLFDDLAGAYQFIKSMCASW